MATKRGCNRRADELSFLGARGRCMNNSGRAGGGAAQKWTRRALVGGVLFVCLALIGVGLWLLTLQRAARAAERGNLERAAALYAAAERPFIGPLAQALPGPYGRALFAQVALS